MSNTKELSQVIEKLDTIAEEFSALEVFEKRIGELKVVINEYSEAHQRAFRQTEQVSQDVANFCISTSEVQKVLASSQSEIHRTLSEYGDRLHDLNTPVLHECEQFRISVTKLTESIKKNTDLVEETLSLAQKNAAAIVEISSDSKKNVTNFIMLAANSEQNKKLIKHLLIVCYIAVFLIILSIFNW